MTPIEKDENGWDEYQNLILYRLDDLNQRVAHLNKCLDQMGRSLAQLEVKSSLWGAAAGALTSIGTAVLWFLVYRVR